MTTPRDGETPSPLSPSQLTDLGWSLLAVLALHEEGASRGTILRQVRDWVRVTQYREHRVSASWAHASLKALQLRGWIVHIGMRPEVVAQGSRTAHTLSVTIYALTEQGRQALRAHHQLTWRVLQDLPQEAMLGDTEEDG